MILQFIEFYNLISIYASHNSRNEFSIFVLVTKAIRMLAFLLM